MAEESDALKSRTGTPQDTLLYAIFPDWAVTAEKEDQYSCESKLKELQVKCLDIISPYVKDYIWQHESFNLQPCITTFPSSCPCVPSSDSNPGPPVPHLHGRLRYGDNVEDEWFAVSLLYEITRTEPYVSARVWDTDGEFLLIEAAYAIPRWLRPENSQNRVFIRRGELHILPMPASPAEIYRLPAKPSAAEAVRDLAGGFTETRAGEGVQAVLNLRLGGYPARARKNMHRSRVRVPVRVAQVLKHEPHLISLAVEAFYDRDVDSMKAAAKMEKFLGDGEMVDVSVRMSKAMYAQLVQQVFQAPRCYPMPPLSAPNYREAELGMKISCGFEMMYHERSQYGLEEDGELGVDRFGASSVENSKLKAARNKDIGWEMFKESLQSKGYFRGLLEASKDHRRLMNEALDYYRSTSLFSRVSSVMHTPVRCIDEILALPHSSTDFVGLDLLPSDDDSWLYNGEEDLNAALQERQKEMDLYETERLKRKQSKNPKGSSSTSKKNMDDFNLDDVAKSMHAFVEKMSSYEGAEVPRTGNSETVSLDMGQFFKELKSAMGDDTANKDLTSQEEYADGSEYSSSDMDFDGTESDSSEAVANGGEVNTTKETERPTDTFMEEYSNALNKQLKNSTLTKSFVHTENPSTSEDTNKSQMLTGGNKDDDLMPVDIDFNLVQNLLDSFSSQQGMPGPASNILGLMGLQLPDDSKTG